MYVSALVLVAAALALGPLAVVGCGASLKGPDHGGRCGSGIECGAQAGGGCCPEDYRCAAASPDFPEPTCAYDGVLGKASRPRIPQTRPR